MMRKINIRPFRGHSTAWLTGCCPAGMKEDLRLNEPQPRYYNNNQRKQNNFQRNKQQNFQRRKQQH